MLSAKKSDIDKVLGLGLGADDYVTKPFSPVELVARIKAHLRRYTQLSSKESNADILTFEKLKIYLESYKVTIEGREISLTAKEFETLRLLASSPSRVYTREQIFNQVWGFNEYGDINTVTVHIKKIREKIEDDPSHPEYIKTVWGVGYKFDGGI
jgi:DNA-binding response OmpR family regulator